MLSFSSLPHESKSNLCGSKTRKMVINVRITGKIAGWKIYELTLCWLDGWWSSCKEERGMWKGGLFPFHWFLSEGEEVNIKMQIFRILFLLFLLRAGLWYSLTARGSPLSLNQNLWISRKTPFTFVMKSPTDLPTLCKWKVQKQKDCTKKH